MKKILLLLTITFSFNSFASEVNSLQLASLLAVKTTVTPTLISQDASKRNVRKMAQQIVVDANEYYQSGNVSFRLGEQITIVQKKYEVSEEEALDIMLDYATSVLN